MCRYHKVNNQNPVCTLLFILPTLQSTVYSLQSTHSSVYTLLSTVFKACLHTLSLLVLVRFLEMRTTLDALPQVDSAIESGVRRGESSEEWSSVNVIYLMPVNSGSKYTPPSLLGPSAYYFITFIASE